VSGVNLNLCFQTESEMATVLSHSILVDMINAHRRMCFWLRFWKHIYFDTIR